MQWAPEQLIEIYKTEHERFKDTRNIQWKVNISLWAVLLFAIEFSTDHKIPMPQIILGIILFSIAVLHFLFSWLCQDALQFCKERWNCITNEIHSLKQADRKLFGHLKKQKRFIWWVALQSAVTISLLIVLFFMQIG